MVVALRIVYARVIFRDDADTLEIPERVRMRRERKRYFIEKLNYLVYAQT
jgi:hypothetical protein